MKNAYCVSILCFVMAVVGPPALSQTQINQAAALAGGVTACDAPGFPVTLCDSGSYALTSNLTVSSGSGIVVEANDVYLDLNGFTIKGGLTSGNGIAANGFRYRTTVINGSVIEFATGLSLWQEACVRNVKVSSNNGNGIDFISGSILDCLVMNNGGWGIRALFSDMGVIRGNTVSWNLGGGIKQQSTLGGLILDNQISFNVGGPGLELDAATAYGNNNLNANGGSAQVTGGVQIGVNLCNGAACP